MTIENVSAGGAGYNAISPKGGRGRVAVPNTPITKKWETPRLESSLQGPTGGSGNAQNRVARPKNPFYSPFTAAYNGNWPNPRDRRGSLRLAPTVRN